VKEIKRRRRNIIGGGKGQTHMLAQATCMACVFAGFATGKTKGMQDTTQGVLSWTAKTGMPQLGVLGGQKSLSLRWTTGCRPSKGIEIAG